MGTSPQGKLAVEAETQVAVVCSAVKAVMVGVGARSVGLVMPEALVRADFENKSAAAHAHVPSRPPVVFDPHADSIAVMATPMRQPTLARQLSQFFPTWAVSPRALKSILAAGVGFGMVAALYGSLRS